MGLMSLTCSCNSCFIMNELKNAFNSSNIFHSVLCTVHSNTVVISFARRMAKGKEKRKSESICL